MTSGPQEEKKLPGVGGEAKEVDLRADEEVGGACCLATSPCKVCCHRNVSRLS